MKKTPRSWRALIISLIFTVSLISPLMTHASTPAARNIEPINVSFNNSLMFDDPEAVYEGARIVHNVTVDGEKGMRVHAKFQVKYGKGVPCMMIAYFYYDDADNTPLKAGDANYQDKKGNVSAHQNFTPAYDPRRYLGVGPRVGFEGNTALPSSWVLEWHVGVARLNGFNGMSAMPPLTAGPRPGSTSARRSASCQSSGRPFRASVSRIRRTAPRCSGKSSRASDFRGPDPAGDGAPARCRPRQVADAHRRPELWR